jgi:osmoprotectant transport system permease protein
VPLGVLATRVRWLERPLLAVAGVIQTIPGLALLAAVVPVLAALRLESIGFLPAVTGLTLYGVLPILRNTVTGIEGVDPALREAARGVGMTAGQQLRRVELPLAMPVIVAGIRTSAVWLVGIATLSTPVGATSLGNYIFSGLQTRNHAAVLVGCAAAAALALVLDGLVRALELGVRARRRALVAGSLAVLAALYGYTGVTLARALGGGRGQAITIGTKTFTEQYILGELLARLVERATGHPTRIVPSLGSTVAFDALRSGDVDLYVDYSGTIWATIMHRTATPPDRAAALREVESHLAAAHGVVVVATLGFENAYTLAMREADARRLGVRRIGDLAPHASRLSIGGDYEFFARPEWRAVRDTYGLRFATERSMDSSLMYQAVAQGSVDVISAFSTDGRIAARGLRVLEDDRRAIPPYDAVVLASARLGRAHPEVIAALRPLADAIDAPRMRAMNMAVDEGGESPAAVAARFLRDLPVPAARGRP